MFVTKFFSQLHTRTVLPITWIDVAETGFNDEGAKLLLEFLKTCKSFVDEIYLDLQVSRDNVPRPTSVTKVELVAGQFYIG